MSVEISHANVLEFLAFLRLTPQAEPGDLELLCLQGLAAEKPSYPNVLSLNDNEANRYNDTIILAHRTEGGEPKLAAFLGTVDPGTAVVKEGGVAHICHGQHQYIRGFHMQRQFGDKYRCLRALHEVNRVWRRREDGAVVVEEDVFGTNVHAGGDGLKPIDDWSVGCVNICGGWTGAPYRLFLDAVDVHFVRRGSVGVTIWSGKDFCRFLELGWAFKPTLRLGIKNPWVAELQQALARKGFFTGTIDGDWRAATEVAVRRFQLSAHLAADGVVGATTWAALS